MSEQFIHQAAKLENPARLAELNPIATLSRFGIQSDDVVCDIGAGSGIFTLAAAQLTQGHVLALELNADLLSVITEKAEREGLSNIETRHVTGQTLPVDSQTIDWALVVTVFHEIPDREPFIRDVARLLKPGGRALVIEFHHAVTPFGPPMDHRIARETVRDEWTRDQFDWVSDEDLGPNFYAQVFQRLSV